VQSIVVRERTTNQDLIDEMVVHIKTSLYCWITFASTVVIGGTFLV
jgi:hypothetical protein